mmetsp:Transcript_62286/g.185563  ORF Transcript_62286/g.185563 Transcript_62286/m.185563 type:complete len:231 (-) Transcript_62286:316-1008(-)
MAVPSRSGWDCRLLGSPACGAVAPPAPTTTRTCVSLTTSSSTALASASTSTWAWQTMRWPTAMTVLPFRRGWRLRLPRPWPGATRGQHPVRPIRAARPSVLRETAAPPSAARTLLAATSPPRRTLHPRSRRWPTWARLPGTRWTPPWLPGTLTTPGGRRSRRSQMRPAASWSTGSGATSSPTTSRAWGAGMGALKQLSMASRSGASPASGVAAGPAAPGASACASRLTTS